MHRHPLVLITALAAIIAPSVQAAAAQQDVLAKPDNTFIRGDALPKWAQPLGEPPTTQRTDPVVLRLADVQQLVGDKPAYLISRAMQVNDHSALGEIGQYSIEYFPAYQKMHLHRVTLLREGKAIDRTASVNTRLLQRETGIEQGTYGGATTVQLLVDDVRIGDTLWVVYSVEGANPVFGNRFAENFGWDSTWPIELRRITVLHPKNRTLQWKQLGDLGGDPVQPQIDEVNGLARLRFEEHGIAATELEPSIPSDFIPARMIEISEYRDWASVAQWATGLFPPARRSPELTALVQQFARQPDRASQASAALQWVQNEVRYFSVSIGENSHRPQAPEVVIKHRYGDCKDKSYLLVSLLHELGIEAHPVLLSATSPRLPAKVAASPGWFDHVIVQLKLDGQTLYVDPTRTGQPSPLDRIDPAMPGAAGLVVDASTTALVTLPDRHDTAPPYEHEEHVVIDALDDDATLESHEIFRSQYAEWARQRYPLMSANELKKDALGLYEKLYPGVTLEGQPTIYDDISHNRFELVARYTLPKPLTEKDGVYKFAYDAKLLDGTLGLPDKLVRKAPFSLPRGRYWGRYRLHIDWPKALRRAFTPARHMLDTKTFQASYDLTSYGNSLDYMVDYRLKSDTVAAADLPTLNTDAKKLDDYGDGYMKFDKSELVSDAYRSMPFRQLDNVREGNEIDPILEQLRNVKGKPSELIKLVDENCDEMANGPAWPSTTVQEHGKRLFTDDEIGKMVQAGVDKTCAARLYFGNGEYAKSLALFEATAPLKDGDAHLRELAWARFYTGDVAESIATMDRYHAGATPNILDVADRIALLQRAGRSLPDTLRQFAGAVPDGPWPRPILTMQIGLITPEALIHQAEALEGDMRELALNDAWYYVAQYQLAQKKTSEARNAFRWFANHGVRSLPYYLRAEHELARLNAASTDAAHAGNEAENTRANLLRDAEAGSAEAQYQLGQIYYYGDGQGSKPDYASALHWYRLAADQQLAEAQNMVGVQYDLGRGVAKDDAQAIAWYQRAIERGDGQAQFNLGLHYENGQGVARDLAKAAMLYKRGAELGNPASEAALADAYTFGDGVKENHVLALSWARRAAMQNHPRGLWRYGWLLTYGKGVDHNPNRAFAMFIQSALLGDSNGKTDLGLAYELGNGVTKDLKMALKWYRSAADQGNDVAQFNLGHCYDDGIGTAQDRTAAAHWYRLAADQGNPDAQNNLGLLYGSGNGVPHSPIVAQALYATSARTDPSTKNWASGNVYTHAKDMSAIELQLARILTDEIQKSGNLVASVDAFLAHPALDSALDYRHAQPWVATSTSDQATTALRTQYQDALNALWSNDLPKAYQLATSLPNTPGFAALPSAEQLAVLQLAAEMGMAGQAQKLAHEWAKRASQLAEASSQTWLLRSQTAAVSGDNQDAAFALQQLAEHTPEALRRVERQYIVDVVSATAKSKDLAEVRLRLLDALLSAHANLPAYTASDRGWRDLAQSLLERGQVDRALEAAKQIIHPQNVISLRDDVRFKRLIKQDPQHFDVMHAMARYIEWSRGIAEAEPRTLMHWVEYVQALNAAQRFDEALGMADTVIKLAESKPVASPPYDDIGDTLPWALNARADVLSEQGRYEEAAAQLVKAAAMKEDSRQPNVSQAINLGYIYIRLGKPAEALAAVSKLGPVSPYGQMEETGVRLYAAQLSGDAPAAAAALDYLRSHQADAPDAFQEGLTRSGMLDEAAALLIKRLQDPALRALALDEVQRYQQSPPTPIMAKWREQETQLLARNDVQQAIASVGNVENIPIRHF